MTPFGNSKHEGHSICSNGKRRCHTHCRAGWTFIAVVSLVKLDPHKFVEPFWLTDIMCLARLDQQPTRFKAHRIMRHLQTVELSIK